MFFGEYLIQLGFITKEDLSNALNIQVRERRSFGQLAVQHGFLERKGLFRILISKREVERKSKYFGSIAEELGLMTREQVDEVLKIQTYDRKLLGAILVSLGAISVSQLVKAIKGHKDLKEKESRKPHK